MLSFCHLSSGMRLHFIFLLVLVWTAPLSAQQTKTWFEQTKGAQTPSYAQIIQFYQQLDRQSSRLKMQAMGPTDAGYPLHVVLFANDGSSDPAIWRKSGKAIILVNNGIHPGEPDGIDASMILLRDLAEGRMRIPDEVALAFIPVYNIGGCLRRSPYYRVDQDGPNEFGSRGSSQNLDLNRDFIKADSREARSFAQLFHFVKPDIFIDNHVSNGADYQHVMTLISSQHNKLGGAMGQFMYQRFRPFLFQYMAEQGYDMVPYVNAFGETPESGWPEFLEGPRYSSGYATLWNCFAFVPETHMLKPYAQRVDATLKLMKGFIRFAATNRTEIHQAREANWQAQAKQSSFPLNWALNRNAHDTITFKGYAAGKKMSMISGLPRLYYDRNKPFTQAVKFFNQYLPGNYVDAPRAYVIPQGWWRVVERLQDNQVQMQQLKRDTVIFVEYHRIIDYKTTSRPYESHYPHSEVQVASKQDSLRCLRGDWLVFTNQPARRFLIETLEPQGDDSYFAWNFFDAILTQKEGYSSYVFEDTGYDYLRTQPALQTQLDNKKKTDTLFAKSAAQQLDFIYKNSPWYEPDHLRYPIYRIR
jgi:hypothetical protein